MIRKKQRQKTLYDPQTVMDYVRGLGEVDIDTITGCLLDTIIIWHGEPGLVEVWEEMYVNPNMSAYARHIYHDGLPKKFADAYREEV